MSEAKHTTGDAVYLCRCLYPVLAPHGIFIGLTGGCLYKTGPRKDIDLLVYRKDDEELPIEETIPILLRALEEKFVIEDVEFYGYVTKLRIEGIPVDILFPEFGPNEYPTEELLGKEPFHETPA